MGGKWASNHGGKAKHHNPNWGGARLGAGRNAGDHAEIDPPVPADDVQTLPARYVRVQGEILVSAGDEPKMAAVRRAAALLEPLGLSFVYSVDDGSGVYRRQTNHRKVNQGYLLDQLRAAGNLGLSVTQLSELFKLPGYPWGAAEQSAARKKAFTWINILLERGLVVRSYNAKGEATVYLDPKRAERINAPELDEDDAFVRELLARDKGRRDRG